MTTAPTPKAFRIRSNGSTQEYTHPLSVSWLTLTAAVVEQILEQGQEDLRTYFGDYHWFLRQTRKGYEFVASYRHPNYSGEFIEGSGRTPREAILGRHQNRIKFQFLGWME